MDYTLALYKPSFEELTYSLALQRLLVMGYPQSISSIKYDPEFPIRYCDQHGDDISVVILIWDCFRGLFLDFARGNFLKIGD